jgi:Putative ATP-dependent Lon protease
MQGAIRIYKTELPHSVLSIASLAETTLNSATGPFRSDGNECVALSLASPFAIIDANRHHWMPRGFPAPKEARLGDSVPFVSDECREALTSWWLAVREHANRPNWDCHHRRSRLVPMVEANCNTIELAPRETGKTYIYRNQSYYTTVLSGGKATPASLFINNATGKVGVVGSRDVVAFDEIANTDFTDPKALVSTFKRVAPWGASTISPRRNGWTIWLSKWKRCSLDRLKRRIQTILHAHHLRYVFDAASSLCGVTLSGSMRIIR